MINLIPPEVRKNIVWEYWIRVLSVWMFLLTAAFLIAAVLLVPTYVLVHSQLASVRTQVSDAQVRQSAFKEAEAVIRSTNSAVAHMGTVSSTTPFSMYIEELQAITGSGIVIEQCSFTYEGDGTLILTVGGIAATRQALTTFNDAVEEHQLFGKADMPISNLIKDRDISFELTIEVSGSNRES